MPPPAHPLPAPPTRAEPVGDLKRLDRKRLLARLLDGVVLLPFSYIAGVKQDDSVYLWMLLVTLLYFFVAEATGAQTLGKRKLGLRVMQRDGSAPSVNQISVRTVLRVIDDGPIGLVVVVLSGKRRQRIGDLLAGTTVGPAAVAVPKPAPSPLLYVYPLGWAVGAAIWIFAGAGAREEESYLTAAQTICERSAHAVAAQTTTAGWIPQLEARYAEYAALRAPGSLRAMHAELLAVELAELELARRFVQAEQRGDRAAVVRIGQRALGLHERRERLSAAGLPACA